MCLATLGGRLHRMQTSERLIFFILILCGGLVTASFLVLQHWFSASHYPSAGIPLTHRELHQFGKLKSKFDYMINSKKGKARNLATADDAVDWDLPANWTANSEMELRAPARHQARASFVPAHLGRGDKDAYKVQSYDVNVEADDIFVVMHIPKTSGKYFTGHLVRYLQVSNTSRCVCKQPLKPHACKCLNGAGHIWLFSRVTTGWPCGVHPGWTDLSAQCLQAAMDKKEKKNRKRRFWLLTVLREPYARFLSEWQQVNREGQWRPYSRLTCFPLSNENSCFMKDDWRNITLTEFINCPVNPAVNRLVRMLADLNGRNCSEVWDWLNPPRTSGIGNATRRYLHVSNNPILKSAIQNLRNMPFFGLAEQQRESEVLFTRTFGVTFEKDFEDKRTRREKAVHVTLEQREQIQDLIRLDVVLYENARDLFARRLGLSKVRKMVLKEDAREAGSQTEGVQQPMTTYSTMVPL